MYTKTTENLKLPQWNGNDHPDWITDVNDAFKIIDTSYGEQGQVTEEMKENITTLTIAMKTVEDNVAEMREIVNSLDPLDSNPIIVAIKSDISSLQTSIADINNNIVTHTTQIQGLTDHVSIMDSDITTIKNQISDINENITSIISSINDLQTKSTEMNETLSVHTQQLATINSTIESINATLTGLQTSVDHATAEADRANATADNALNTATIAEANAKAANQQSALAHTDAENAISIANEAKQSSEEATTNALNAVTTANQAMEIAQEALDKINEGGGGTSDELEPRVTNLESTVSTIEGQLSNVNSSIATITETTNNLGTSVSSIETQISTINNNITELNSQFDTLSESTLTGLDGLTSELTKTNDLVSANTASIQEVEETINDPNNGLSYAVSGVNNNSTRITNAENQINTLTNNSLTFNIINYFSNTATFNKYISINQTVFSIDDESGYYGNIYLLTDYLKETSLFHFELYLQYTSTTLTTATNIEVFHLLSTLNSSKVVITMIENGSNYRCQQCIYDNNSYRIKNWQYGLTQNTDYFFIFDVYVDGTIPQ